MSFSAIDCTQIRVLLADRTKMACQLLADAIGQDPKIVVIGAMTTPAETIQKATDTSPDIILVGEDIDGQSARGFELVRQLRLVKPQVAVVMMLDRLNGSSVVEAFRAHASGVFTRDGSVESLRKCIYSVFSGQVWASSEVLRFVLGALAGTSKATVDLDSMALLTKREREVVGLAVDGVKNREIARRLGLSEHTVKNYLFSIFGKLGVSSRLELTLAVKREWIQGSNIVSIKNSAPARSDEVLAWLRALAEQGLASAQLLLAQMYSEGQGVAFDRTQAYRLFLLAEKSAQIVEISRSARKKLAGEMSAREIADAELQATMWLEKNGKLLTKPFPVAKTSY